MGFSNYFGTQCPTPIPDNMTMAAATPTQQYLLPTESLDFISNSNTNLVDQEMLPLIDNLSGSMPPMLNEKSTNQFSCKDCSKTYVTVSGLNNHMKK